MRTSTRQLPTIAARRIDAIQRIGPPAADPLANRIDSPATMFVPLRSDQDGRRRGHRPSRPSHPHLLRLAARAPRRPCRDGHHRQSGQARSLSCLHHHRAALRHRAGAYRAHPRRIKGIIRTNPPTREDGLDAHGTSLMLYCFVTVPDGASELVERQRILLAVAHLADRPGVEFARDFGPGGRQGRPRGLGLHTPPHEET